MRRRYAGLLFCYLLAGAMSQNALAIDFDEAFRLTKSTLALVEKREKRPELAARLQAMKGKQKNDNQAVRELLKLRREILFSQSLSQRGLLGLQLARAGDTYV